MKQLRINIDDFFKDLSFIEETHKYFVKGEPLKKSVSGLIHRYEFPTDWDKVLKQAAEKRGVTPEVEKARWKKEEDFGCALGTETHLFAEAYAVDRTLKPKTGHQRAVVNFWNDLPDFIVPLFLELKMYHKEIMFAGTADLIFYNTKTKQITIGDYKGLPLDTPILTEKGWSDMKSLKVNDKVFDKDGNLCNVKVVSNIHNKKCLKIIFDNNEEIVSDYEHRWLVSKINGKSIKNIVMTTQEIQDYYEKMNLKYNNQIPSYLQLRIFNTKPLSIKNKTLPIDPYVLGVWLGDGHKQDNKITQEREDIWNEIKERGYDIGEDVSQGGAGKATTRTIFGIRKYLKELNLLENKHLPEKYLLSSETQRLDLLRGFMDADGYYNPKRKRFVLGTTKREQIDIAVPLLASLGIKPTVIECNKYCNDKIIKGWDICFTTTKFNPFLKRNQNIVVKTNKQNEYRRILLVENVEQVPTKCIEVDSKSHTFLAGKSLIPTHNTNKDLFKNFKRQRMQGPFGHLIDCPFNHYQLQLSYYQILLEQYLQDTDVKVVGRKLIYLKDSGDYEIYELDDYTEVLREELKLYGI